MIPKEYLEKLKSFAEQDTRIVSLHVFGSEATGRAGNRSDVDVAIMVRSEVEASQRIRWERELSVLLSKDVDVVVFNRATPLLQHQILKYGLLVHEKDPKERVRQEVISRRHYLDTRSLYRLLEG